jgi:hypothetical protein
MNKKKYTGLFKLMNFSLFSPAMTVTVTVAATAVTVVADLVGNLLGHLLFHLERDRIAVLVGDLLACLWEVAIFNN